MLRHRPLALVTALSLLSTASAFAQTDPAPSGGGGSDSSSGTSYSGLSMNAPATPSSEPSEGGLKQKRNGFAVALGLVTRLPVIQSSGTDSAIASGMSGDLFAGYKMDRFLFGLGFEIDHIGSSTQLASNAGTATTTTKTTSFLFTPGLQVAALRAASGRLELLGSVQFGFGRAVTTRTDDPVLPPNVMPEYQTTNFHLKYQIGPGLRFFFIPQFAISLLSGIEGDHFFASQDTPSGLRADQLNNVSVFGKLGLLGVF